MCEGVGLVDGLDVLGLLAVLLGVCLGVLLGALDFLLGEAGGALDGDVLLLAGVLVASGDLEDAVGIDVERHLNLGHAARCGLDAVQLEVAEQLVVVEHLSLALADADVHGGLVVGGGGEHLALLDRDGGVAVDHGGGDAAHGLDGERERGHVQQEHIVHITHEHAALDGGTHGHHFVRVHALVGFLAGQALGHFLHGGHAGHAAHEHELVDIGGVEPGGGDAVADGAGGALQQGFRELLQLAAGHGHLDVLGPGGVHGDERQGDIVALGGGEGDLGLLRLLLDTLQGIRLLGDVHALLGLELVENPVDDGVVPVVAAQVGVAVGGLHLEHAVADFQHGDIEGAAAEVVHGNLLVALLVQAVRQRGGGGLVDDAAHLEPGDFTGGLGGVALGVVEVGGHGDDGLRDGLAELGLGIRLQLGEHHGADLLRGVHLGLAAHLHLDVGVAVGGLHDGVGKLLVVLRELRVLAADEALGGEHGVARVGDGLALGGLAHDALAGLGECHDGRSGTRAFAVFKDSRLPAFHHGHAGVRGTEVDSEYLAHFLFFLS